MNQTAKDEQLERGLTNRHLQLLAIGGTIGTGLFLGVGKTIIVAGPSTILAYLIAGTICFFSMRVLGEMLLSNLNFRTFRDITTAYLGHWSGFFIGCIYFFVWISASILDSVAAGIYLQEYFPNIPIWLTSVLLLAIIFMINIGSVKNFGEAEFWLAIVKIVAIVLLIGVGIYLFISQHTYQFTFTDNGRAYPEILTANLSNLWDNGGFFPNGFIGFGLGFQMAFFAFGGMEAIASTSAETSNPEKTMPRAINAIPIRILLFYVGSIFVILCCVPWTRITMIKGSPFANIFSAVGLPEVGAFMIIVLITAAASGANAGVYISSRMLYGLSADRQIPRIFSKTSKHHSPIFSLIFCASLVAIIDIIGGLIFGNPMQEFAFFAALATVGISSVWILVLLTYFVFRKKYSKLHNESKFKAPCGLALSTICITVFITMYITMFFAPDTRLAIIILIILSLFITILYYFGIKKKERIDF
ncbi:MAG: amino acid permease [Bifidobacteriaceae bacterium]|jgi:D-serine/D-alanine/glycine transporter|nr:amino acid permease [Bifidobacteriaceae bacterium]